MASTESQNARAAAGLSGVGWSSIALVVPTRAWAATAAGAASVEVRGDGAEVVDEPGPLRGTRVVVRAEDRRRVDGCGHQHTGRERDEGAPLAADAVGRAEHRLGGGRSEAAQHVGRDGFELPFPPLPAGRDLARVR